MKKRSERFEPAFFLETLGEQPAGCCFQMSQSVFFGTGGRCLELIVFSDFVLRMLCAFYHGVNFYYQIAI